MKYKDDLLDLLSIRCNINLSM